MKLLFRMANVAVILQAIIIFILLSRMEETFWLDVLAWLEGIVIIASLRQIIFG